MKIQIIQKTDACADTTSLARGGLFGDGFFTTGIIEDSQLLHQALHLARLRKSAQRLKFTDFNDDVINETLAVICAQQRQAIIRISVERTQHQRGYSIAADHGALATFYVSPWIPSHAESMQAFFATTPVSINPLLAGIKHLNRLDNVLAASECQSSAQEALMCDREEVICGSRSNFFAFISGKWKTPYLNKAGIVGITRQRLLSLFASQRIECGEANISKNDLINCRSAFLTNSVLGMVAISRIQDKALDTQLVRDLQSQLQFTR